MATGQISIQRLNLWLLAMLTAILIIVTIAGYTLLNNTYNLENTEFQTDAKNRLDQSVKMVRSQLNFNQSILDAIARNPKLPDLINFGKTNEVVNWTMESVQLLPNALGLAVTDDKNTVIGDAAAQRVGPICQRDIKFFNAGTLATYPPVHTTVAGLEHFDLYTLVKHDDSDATNALIVSFRLTKLTQLLDQFATDNQSYALSIDGQTFVNSSNIFSETTNGLMHFSQPVPDTSWTLTLSVPYEKVFGLYGKSVLATLLGTILISIMIYLFTAKITNHFRRDIRRIHQALLDVSKGNFEPSEIPTALSESQNILPDIEKIALQLQIRNNELETQTLTDDLTGVANRRYFNALLLNQYELSQRVTPAHLVMIDVNDFKLVNDQFGHTAGDELLQQISKHFLQHVRTSDTVARLGGDEFAILLQNMESSVLCEWADNFILAFDTFIREPEIGQTRNVSISLSIGIAAINALEYESAEAVSQAADKAMYRAKAQKSKTSKALFATPPNQTI